MDPLSLFEMLDRAGRQPSWIVFGRKIGLTTGPVQSIEIRSDTIKPMAYGWDYEKGDPVYESYGVTLVVVPGIPKSPWMSDFRIFTNKTESIHGGGRAGFFGSDAGTGVMNHLNSDPTVTDAPQSVPDIKILFARLGSGSKSTHKDMESQSGFVEISFKFDGPEHDPRWDPTLITPLDYSDWEWFERIAQHLVGTKDSKIQVKDIVESRDSTDENLLYKREGNLARLINIDRLLWGKPYRGSAQFKWYETDISSGQVNIKYWVGINGKKIKLESRESFSEVSIGNDVMIRHRLFGNTVRVEPIPDDSDIPR